MSHFAKESGRKVKMGMTVFVILLLGAGAGVYAYVEPDRATPSSTVPNNEWRYPTASDKKESVVPPGTSGAMKRETSRRYMMQLQDQKPSSVQASSNNPHEPFQSLSDSDKQKFLVLLALWSIKS